MQAVRLYSGEDGESHFEDLPALFASAGLQQAARQKAAEIIFVGGSGRNDLDWHTAPRRQYLLFLSGHSEIEVGDGSVRRFDPGDLLLAEDLTGHGHLTRTWGDERRVVFVPLAEEGTL